MKTDAVKQTIISNYKILAEKSQVKSNHGNIKTFWGLQYRPNYKQEGFVTELGTIGRKKAKIEVNDGRIIMLKKPLFSTWNKTLKNINSMLETIISNFDNSEVVHKKYVNMKIFNKDFVERLSKIK